jgi:hypothetical protein
MSVEVLAGLSPIRQKLLFLNERFLVLALVKPNDLLMVQLDELYRIWMNSNCLPEWQIGEIPSRTHFLTEFDLHLVDLTFVPRVHNGVLVPIIAPRLLGEVLGKLQGPTAINTDGSKTEGLVEIEICLDDKYSYRFILPGSSLLKCAPFILLVIQSNLNRWVRTLLSQIALPLLRDRNQPIKRITCCFRPGGL